MKVIMHPDFINDLKYSLSDKWSSFTYIFRKRWYRLKLFKRFMKHEYYGAWEMCHPVLEIPMEIFCEFYENGGMENICYSEGYWKEWREKADFLYKWWTEDYKTRQEEINYLLHVWCEHHRSWIGEPDDKREAERGMLQCFSAGTRYSEFLLNLLSEEEEKFENEKDEALRILASLRRGMWT